MSLQLAEVALFVTIDLRGCQMSRMFDTVITTIATAVAIDYATEIEFAIC